MAGIRDLIVATLHDRLGYRPENAADPGERFAFPHAAEIADALAPVFEAKLSELAGERDRARDVAVALEQELAGYDARVEAALKQVIRTAGTVDAREQVGFVLAGWQDPDPDPIGVPPSVATRAVEIATDVDWPDLVRTRVSLTVDDPDAHRPAVAAGEWVRILERPAGRPAGQIGKVIPPGFTPPSTVASRVIAVKVGPADSIDASAWEVIDHPGQAVVVAQPHSFYPAGLPQFCQTCGGIESDPQHQPAPGSERQGNQ